MAALIAFGGLPGTGKTTLARAIAIARGAIYLRIDEIEQALRSVDPGREVGVAGYGVAEALARSNLGLGRDVVADAVNPVAAARAGWREVGRLSGSRMIGVSLVCSNAVEHRRRIETREIDIAGLAGPDWDAIGARRYEPWHDADIHLDTAGQTPDASIAEILGRLDALLTASGETSGQAPD